MDTTTIVGDTNLKSFLEENKIMNINERTILDPLSFFLSFFRSFVLSFFLLSKKSLVLEKRKKKRPQKKIKDEDDEDDEDDEEEEEREKERDTHTQ